MTFKKRITNHSAAEKALPACAGMMSQSGLCRDNWFEVPTSTKSPTYPLVATTGGTKLARIAGPSTANCPSKHNDTAPTGTYSQGKRCNA